MRMAARAALQTVMLLAAAVLPHTAWTQPDPAQGPAVPQSVWPAIVAISTLDESGSREFLAPGFVLNSDGVVATAWPNIAGTSRLEITFSDGTTFAIDEVIGWDEKRRDFALLKGSAKGRAALILGDFDGVRPGSPLVVAGIGEGGQRHEWPATAGRLVYLLHGERWLEIESDLPETASGAPVLDSEGKVVGLALALPAEGRPAAFVVSIGDVRRLLDSDSTVTRLSEVIYREVPRAVQRDFYVSNLLACSGRTPESTKLLHAALKTAPQFADIHTDIAWNDLTLGHPEDALAAAKRALALLSRLTHPEFALAVKAQALLELGRDREAESSAQEAVRIAPESAGGHSALGRVYAAKGRWHEAEEQFRESIRLDPGFSGDRCGLARVYVDSGRTEAAIAQYGEAIARNPQDARARCGLGYAYHMSQDNASAELVLRKAVELDPTLAGAHLGLGYAYAASESWNAAREEIEKAARLDPEDRRIIEDLLWVNKHAAGDGDLGFMILYSRVSNTKWAPAYGALSTFNHGQLVWFLLIILMVGVIWQAIAVSGIDERKSWMAVLWAVAVWPALLTWSLHHRWVPGSAAYLIALGIGGPVALAWLVYGAWQVAPLFSLQPEFSKPERIPQEPRPRPEPPAVDWTAAPRPGTEPVQLCQVASAMEAEVVRSALSAAGIPSAAHSHGVIHAYLAKTTQPVAADYIFIFVPRKAVEHARWVLTAVASSAIQWPEGLEPGDADGQDDPSRS